MDSERIIATNLGQLVGAKPGTAWCARCGREMRVRTNVRLHVCQGCRYDRDWMRAMAEHLR
jgi:Zn finger protein HypA/HybF involved in hydrogenase expression